MSDISELRKPKAWMSDMDGVLVHESLALPGAHEFIETLKEKSIPFLVLTNNSIYTNRDLSARLASSGLQDNSRFWFGHLTSSLKLAHVGVRAGAGRVGAGITGFYKVSSF